MITREYKVDGLPEISVHMDFANQALQEQGIRFLKQVLLTKPRTAVIKRTPLATPARYDWYVRKDGKKTRTKHMSGGSKALRNAVTNDIVRDVSGAKSSVTFGAHATATLDYAPYVHEAMKPKEGEYWQEEMYGYGRGWTTPNTGNRFVEKSVVDHADYIPNKVNELLDKYLAEGGA